MYQGVKTWNPVVGCNFLCIYCDKSFQKQMRRQMRRCFKCYLYTPHFHPERLNRLPNSKIIFVCGFSDVAHAKEEWLEQILEVIEQNTSKTFYIQTKDPAVYQKFDFPDNVLKGVTLETNLDKYHSPSLFVDYESISKAPKPSERIKRISEVDYITVEPVLDFSEEFASIIAEFSPIFVYIGYDNHNCHLPEPTVKKTVELTEELKRRKVEVIEKTIRPAWYETF